MKDHRPIFLIGTGRCGSTILFEVLTNHPDLVWWSQYHHRFPAWDSVSALNRIYQLPGANFLPRGEKRQFRQGKGFIKRLCPCPNECYNKWERLCGRKFRYSFLYDQTASDEEAKNVQGAVKRAVKFQGGSRFIAKITGPSRISYLRSIFPDAIFIHVVRDARAVISSWLNVQFWIQGNGYNSPRWEGGLHKNWEEEWRHYDNSPVALAALQYRAIMRILEEELSQLQDQQYMEMTYQDFVTCPDETVEKTLSFCGLQQRSTVKKYLQSQRYVNKNEETINRLSDYQKKMIRDIIEGHIPNRLAYPGRG